VSLGDRLRKLDAKRPKRAPRGAGQESGVGGDGRGVPQVPKKPGSEGFQAPPATAPLTVRLGRNRTPKGSGPPRIAEASAVEETVTGGVKVRRTRYPIEEQHGHGCFVDVHGVDPGRIGLAGRTTEDFDVHDCVFMDTETSDLGGGASVYVFLTGCLFVERDQIIAEQILLTGPEDEAIYLEKVREALLSKRHMVSFSGKSFDRHRLDDRFALVFGERPLREHPHLDLYHLGRRLYKDRLRNTRLQTFERELLGVHRTDDLPGAECPEVWFDFLEGFDDGRMERVMEHNLIDVLSLLPLLTRLDHALAAPLDGLEAARAGLLFDSLGVADRAVPYLEKAVDSLRGEDWRLEKDLRSAALGLARRRRKDGDSGAAMEVLGRLSQVIPADAEVEVELAKIAERDLKDRALALDHAREARARLSGRGGGRQKAALREGVAKRILRLETALQRQKADPK